MFKFLKDSWQDARRRVEQEDQARERARRTVPDMSAIAHQFAASLAQQGVTLDFTSNSMLLIDGLVAATRHDLSKRAPADRKTQENMAALNIGAYVGDVLRRDLGGVWTAGDDGLPALDAGGVVAPVVGAVLSLLLHERVDMPGGPVSSLQAYVAAVSRAARTWLETVVRGRSDSLESLQREMSDQSELAAWLVNETALAVMTARTKWTLALDFTPKSLDGVEQVLGQLHEVMKSAPANDRPTEKQTEAAAVAWGVYVGEVIRRHYGGKWAISEPDGVLQLEIGSSRVFPVRKVQKRLVNGPGDAIPFYFTAMGSALAAK